MKLLLLSLFHPEIVPGGAQQVCFDIFQEAKKSRDIDCTMLSAIDSSKKHFFKPGAVITGFDQRPGEFLFLMQGYDYWNHTIESSIIVDELLNFVTTVNPDVVHVHHFLGFGIDVFALIRRAVPNCRIIFTCHEFLLLCAADGHLVKRNTQRLCFGPSESACVGCFPERSLEDFFLRKMWFKINLEFCDSFVFPSKFMMPFFSDFGLDAKKFIRIENCRGQDVVHTTELPKARNADRICFGFFGQMVDNKGFLLLIEAIDILRLEGLNFFVKLNGGNLNYASEKIRDSFLKHLSDEKKLDYHLQRFEWSGAYSKQEVQGLMAEVDVVVVPSVWWEIYGLVITEAWLHGKPVIGSDVGGPGERIVEQVNGMRFSVGNAKSLAGVMRRFIVGELKVEDFDTAAFLPPTRAEFLDLHLKEYRKSS